MEPLEPISKNNLPSRLEPTEIPLSVFGILDRFAVGQKRIVAFLKDLELPNAESHRENIVRRSIDGEKFNFELRRNGSHRVWVVTHSDHQRFCDSIGFPERETVERRRGPNVPPITDDLIAVSHTGLGRVLPNLQMYKGIIKSLKLPDPSETEENTYSVKFRGETFNFLRVQRGTKVTWALKLFDVERLSAAHDPGAKSKSFAPSQSENRVVLSRSTLAQSEELRGNVSKLLKTIPDIRVIRGPSAHISFRGQKFELTKGTVKGQPVWTISSDDYKTLTESLRKDSQTQSSLENRIVLSRPGLRTFFVVSENFTSLLKELPNPKVVKHDKINITADGESFELVKAKVSYQPVWTISREDAKRFARCFDLKERIYTEDFLEDAELANVVALIGSDPLKLHKYIQVFYPDLLHEAAISVASRWIEGLGGAPGKVSPYLGFSTQLSPPLLSEPTGKRGKGHKNIKELTRLGCESHEVLSVVTSDNSVILKGRGSKGTDFIIVEGAFSRKIAVDKEGNFSAPVPLPKTGEYNCFAIRAIDSERRSVSEPVFLSVRQRGVQTSIEESFFLLLQKKEQILAEVTKDSVRRGLLMEQIELSLLKSFTESEKMGFSRLRARIKQETSPIRKKMLKEVLGKFEVIAEADYGLVGNQKLYFFQKYTIHEVRSAERVKLPGIIVANEQGLGKTLTALSLSRQRDLTIIAPNAVVTNWISEERKFIPSPRLTLLEGSYEDRDSQLAKKTPRNVVINLEYTRSPTQTRIKGLSKPEGIVIIDEADYLGSRASEQAKGTRKIDAQFKVLLSATPFKRPSQITNVLGFMSPEDARFHSGRAFARAFPTSSPTALSALHLLMNERTIRIRKDDVFDTYDPKIPLAGQKDRLPGKKVIDPNDAGKFVLTNAQCHSILELLTNYESWCSKHRGMETASDRDFYRYREGFFAKKEALRQISNSPAYIGRPELNSPKHRKMDEIVRSELSESDRKVLIFCRYKEQVIEYARRYRSHGACTYFGGLKANADGYKVDKNDEVLFFKVDNRGEFSLDQTGAPIVANSESGKPMRALDYEKLLFQNSKSHRVMLATYDSGAVGVTFTAADAVIFDDLAPTYRDEYQAGDRAHRIDNQRKKYEIKYYWLISEYPKAFLTEMKEKGLERFFIPGTFDSILYDNIRLQGRIFHRIMDGVGSEDELRDVESLLSERMPFLFNKEDGLDNFKHLIGDEIEESELSTERDRRSKN